MSVEDELLASARALGIPTENGIITAVITSSAIEVEKSYEALRQVLLSGKWKHLKLDLSEDCTKSQ